MDNKYMIIQAIVFLVLGGASGVFIPGVVKKILKIKMEKRGDHNEPIAFTEKKYRILFAAADAVLSALIGLSLKVFPAVIALVMFQIVMICISTDHYLRIIPNEAVLVLLGLSLIFRVLAGGFSSLPGGLAAFAVTTVIFFGAAFITKAIRGTMGVGAGDIKYSMALAIAVGWQGLIWFFVGLAAALIIYCLVGMTNRTLRLGSYFPMCICISAGFYLYLISPVIEKIIQ